MAGYVGNLSCLWFPCSWQTAGRRLKVVSPLETWFCPSTASPQRAWTTWRPRTRSRAALETSASPCRSKPRAPTLNVLCVCVCMCVCMRGHKTENHSTLRWFNVWTCTGSHLSPWQHRIHTLPFKHSQTNPPSLHRILKSMLPPFNPRHPAHRQMFTVVVGINLSSNAQQCH